MSAKVKSADEDELVHLRENSNWFQWFQISMKFAFVFQDLPFSLNFEEGRYVVKTKTFKSAKFWMWAAFHICGAVVFWTEVASMIKSINQSHDQYQYFDLLYSMGWLMFDYPIMYIWLCRLDLVQEFLDELQSTKVFLPHSSPRNKTKSLLFALGVAWYLNTTFMFFPIRWGVFEWSLENYYKTLESACELHLGISKSHRNQIWYPAAILVTFLITSFQYNTLLCQDMLAVSGIMMMKNIAVDLDRAIRSGNFSVDQVFELLGAYKKLTRKFNRAFGLLVCVYVVYASPYYSLHFIDMVETPGLANQLSMLTYVVVLGLASKWAIDILIMAKRRKRWLTANNRLLQLDRSACSVMLDDITWEKYGLGTYYTVNPFVTGQVFSLIATVAIVRIQSLKAAAI